MENQPIVAEGRNCWRKRPANRVSFLIDAAAYFEAFVSALEQAQRSIYIVGWDVDRRIALLPNRNGIESPLRLGDLLTRVAAKKGGLRVHVLVWDFTLIFALEREPHLLFKTGWRRHGRIRFHMDGNHPLGASHHQKIVVVEDKVAFAGGIDLTKPRWDTPEHLPEDPRRKDPLGFPYGPFHDVQMLVDGEAARSLGELARERWRRATGRVIRPLRASGGDPWPVGLAPDLTSVDVAIARTEPEFKGRQAVREVERLYRDSIERAAKSIYIENQYLTSKAIEASLASTLSRSEGPEVLIVLPRKCDGWLQEGVMGSLRARVLHQLREADKYGRLRVYFPCSSPSDQGEVMVHAKVMIVDNRLVRVGSANLSNRSMGLDSECDLAIESGEDPCVEEALTSFRNRLLAEHLGVSPGHVEAAAESGNSLIRAVEKLLGRDRTLVTLETDASEWIEALSSGSELFDPEQPTELDHMINHFVHEDEESQGWDQIRLVLLICLFAGLALLWRYGPLEELLNAQTAAALASKVAHTPAPALWVVLAFVTGSLVVVPVTLLITATAAVFDPVSAFAYALAGSLVSATIHYGLGSVLGRNFVRRIAGRRLNRLSRRLAKKGFVAILVVRMLPIAPFTAVNAVAGASHIRFKDFLLGTLAGMTPGIVGITLLTDRVKSVVKEPGVTSILSLTVVLFLVGGGVWFLTRRVRRTIRQTEKTAAAQTPYQDAP